MASLYSFDSDFDRFMRNEKTVSEDVKKGFNLFMGKANCATCHFAPHFSGLVPPFFNENESEVLGITTRPIKQLPVELDKDLGRGNSPVKKEKSWIYDYSFKTVTVRNIALTKPYFHNGAFNTLEEVLDFYNEGGGEGLGLKMKNQTLASASSLEKDLGVKKTSGVEAAKKVGELIAKRAKEVKVSEIVFDRGGYLFHGRVKAVAEAAREAGLKF